MNYNSTTPKHQANYFASTTTVQPSQGNRESGLTPPSSVIISTRIFYFPNLINYLHGYGLYIQTTSNHLCKPILIELILAKVSTPRSSHISPLHHQAVRGRNIIITENPHLHLVWYYHHVYIKPLPKYLLSYAFWQYLATLPTDMQQAAIGFMRTYSYLIRHESDFLLGQEKGLIPKNDPSKDQERLISFDSFAKLISPFDSFGDEMVSPRYSYGELRLTRLNFYSRIFLRKLTYHHIDAQWGSFFGSAIAPFAVIFIIITVVLNAMQVELAVWSNNDIEPSWAAFINVSKWFCVVILLFTLLVILFVLFLVVLLFIHDTWFALRILREKKKNPQGGTWSTRKSGVV